MTKFKTKQVPLQTPTGLVFKTFIFFGDFVIAGLNDQSAAECLAIEMNELLRSYVESELLAFHG